MVPGCRETHSWLRVEPVNAQFHQKPTISCFLADFLGNYYWKENIGFLGVWGGGFEFLIRKRFNFPEPFRLVRKTLLFRSLLISEDLVRQKSSYEPKCSENLSFCPNSGGRFSGGLLDFRLFVKIF